MKTIIGSAVIFVVLSLTTGCETPSQSRREQAAYPSYILNLRPKLTAATQSSFALPLCLAVVQVGEPAPPKAMLDRLQSEHSLVASAAGLPSWEHARNSTNSVEKAAEQVDAICRLAQSVGAGQVFIFGGNMESWCDGNAMRFLDFTLVGGALFPSTKIHAEGKAAGTLIDAATREPMFLVSVDAKRSTHSPTFQANGKTDTLCAALRDELTVALTDELLRTLTNRKHSATASHTTGEATQTR